MALFAVIAPQPAGVAVLQSAIQAHFPDNYLLIGSNVWVVSALGIAKDVSDKLTGVPVPQGAPQVIVFAISGYFGLAPNTYWEWIAAKVSPANVR
jgi:hypothetical protein